MMFEFLFVISTRNKDSIGTYTYLIDSVSMCVHYLPKEDEMVIAYLNRAALGS